MAINYEQVGWDTSKYVNPTRMNHMDDGIKAACDKADEHDQQIETINSNLESLGTYKIADDLDFTEDPTKVTKRNDFTIMKKGTNDYSISFMLTTVSSFSAGKEYKIGELNKKPYGGIATGALLRTSNSLFLGSLSFDKSRSVFINPISDIQNNISICCQITMPLE